MTENTKRILLGIGLLIVTILAGYGIWYLFFRPVFAPPTAPAPALPAALPTVGLPPAAPAAPREPITPAAPSAGAPTPVAQGGSTRTATLSSQPVLSPFLSADGRGLQFYNRTDGKFYRVGPDGTLTPLSDKVFFNVSNVTWAPNSTQAILEYPDGSNILYDFANNRQRTLPRHWQEFDFSPNSDKIAFLSIGQDEDSRWLATASPDGSGTAPIEPLGPNADKVQVAWSPNNQVIAFSATGEARALNEQDLLLVGQHGENFRALTVNGIGFSGRWSPDGQRILYSATSSESDWKPALWIVDGTPDRIGANKTPLQLNTWAHKCAFGSVSAVYCAVPVELDRGTGLYPQAVGNTPDVLWQVNLQTGERRLLARPDGNYTINSLVVSEDERYLYFTDAISGQLHKIDLR